MGEALEEYIKDLFANTLEVSTPERLEKQSNLFSYKGNQNNPPDFMIKGGDAIEVKKIETKCGSISLNSSYPKHKLYSTSQMITKDCRVCEEWTEKDIIYAVGEMDKKTKTLRALSFVYGEDLAATEDIYERIILKIKKGILNIPDMEFNETKELGRVNRVDPLGVTYLRIRGMWGIENPFKVFNYILEKDIQQEASFSLIAVINERKWKTFDNTKELEKVIKSTKGASLSKVKIKNPNNPSELKPAYLIQFNI